MGAQRNNKGACSTREPRLDSHPRRQENILFGAEFDETRYNAGMFPSQLVTFPITQNTSPLSMRFEPRSESLRSGRSHRGR